MSSSPDPVLRPVTVRLVSAPEPIMCSVCVCACGPVLHAWRCVRLTGCLDQAGRDLYVASHSALLNAADGRVMLEPLEAEHLPRSPQISPDLDAPEAEHLPRSPQISPDLDAPEAETRVHALQLALSSLKGRFGCKRLYSLCPNPRVRCSLYTAATPRPRSHRCVSTPMHAHHTCTSPLRSPPALALPACLSPAAPWGDCNLAT